MKTFFYPALGLVLYRTFDYLAIEANYESVNEKLKKLTLAKDKQVESAASLETSLNEVKKELEEAKTNKVSFISSFPLKAECISKRNYFIQNEVDEKLKSLTDELAVQKEGDAISCEIP